MGTGKRKLLTDLDKLDMEVIVQKWFTGAQSK